ncbi:MAG: cobalamin biosynthesis protein [Micromonosporaceae bacterium]|nr:cobalamin biosynthesis protein [Micromonosporaceae bacterium]
MPWHSLLVLGGIGSGQTGFAESVLAEHVAPAAQIEPADPADPVGVRRLAPTGGGDLAQLARLLSESKPDQTLLVTGLDDWLPPRTEPAGAAATAAAAVRDCPARLVLVSPEVGLSTAPSTAANRTLAELLGSLNRALAEVVDAVVLIVAGQPVWLKGGPGAAAPGGSARAVPATDPVTTAAASPEAAAPDLTRLKALPVPDEEAKLSAAEHLTRLGTVSLGALAPAIGYAAGAQRVPVPAPWRQVRVLVLLGDHAGAAAAGAPGSAHAAGQLRAGTSPLAQLAAPMGARVQIVEVATAGPLEDGPAMATEQVEPTLGYGWRLAQQAVDEGCDLLVLGALGDGADTAAAAVTAVLAPNTEPAGLLARVRTEQGLIDDAAWMRRCAAVRDAVHRSRSATRTAGRVVLAELGGPDLATATGILLGAAARRTPVVLDGPVGAAAALVARNLAPQSRHWCLLPDHGGHPTVVRAAEVLGLTPWLDLRLALGEGATALATLPLLQAALALAGTLPVTASAPS